MNVSMEKALVMVRQNDLERAERMRQLYAVEWVAPHLYDLVLNTEKLSVDAAASALVHMARRSEFKATVESKKKLHELLLASRIRAGLKARRATQNVDIDIQVTDQPRHFGRRSRYGGGKARRRASRITKQGYYES